MSKFSAFLKELLSQRGEPIARIAKNTGLERTSIHKALKDERLLSYTAVRRLCDYLQLTLPQVRELNMYYQMLLQGEESYRTQETICELLGELSQLHFSCAESLSKRKGSAAPPRIPSVLYGHPQIESAVLSLLKWEADTGNPEFSLYLPPEFSSVAASLLQLWTEGSSCTVRQLVAFLPERSGEDNRRKNLHLLKKLLPLSLISKGSYFAYYYFQQDTSLVSIDPLPFFILTPHYLIHLDQGLSVAQFETSPELIRLYAKRFSQILKECQLLNSYSGSLEHILDSYMQGTSRDSYYTLMTQPCLGRYYTLERISRHIRPGIPNREAVIQLCDQRFQRLRELNGNYYTIFTEEGLRQFARDGIIVDLPPELVLPVSPSVRRELLWALRQDMEEGHIKGCIADMERLPIPPYLTLTCDPTYGVHIYTVQGFIQGAYACSLHIQETGIGQSFCSFIRFLPDSRYVYPLERTLSVLDELIETI